MIVDAHHHLWRPERGYAWLDAPGLARIRRPFTPADLGPRSRPPAWSQRSWWRAAGAMPTRPGVPRLRRRHRVDRRRGGLGRRRRPGPAATLRRYRQLRGGELLVGIRSQVQGEPDPDYLDRPDVRRGPGHRRRRRARVRPGDPRRPATGRGPGRAGAATTCASCSTTSASHASMRAAPAWPAGAEPFAALGRCANVTCKLSGMVTEAGPQWTVEALRAVRGDSGPRRSGRPG